MRFQNFEDNLINPRIGLRTSTDWFTTGSNVLEIKVNEQNFK